MERMKEKEFDRIYALMEQSFPETERRNYTGQLALLREPCYRIWVQHTPSGEAAGFAAVWELDDFVFLEHLAVDPQLRNGGLGAHMLAQLRETYDAPICLEAELPQTPQAVRRIGFYRRNGFCPNDYPYIQPPMGPGKASIPLCILTARETVDAQTFAHIRDVLYEKVYRVK